MWAVNSEMLQVKLTLGPSGSLHPQGSWGRRGPAAGLVAGVSLGACTADPSPFMGGTAKAVISNSPLTSDIWRDRVKLMAVWQQWPR